MKQHSSRFLELAGHAKEIIKETDVDTVKQRLADGENLTLIDVREDREWIQGHLPNAIHLAKGVIECYIEVTVPDTSQEIILYCGGGYRSAIAAKSLQEMGYTNVYSMQGGISGWAAAGGEITHS